MSNELKVEFYDDFNCIADACSYTCCQGWDIIVDIDTYNTWKSNETKFGHISKNIKTKKIAKDTQYFIKMGNKMRCPFLDDSSLCNIVSKCGKDYLSEACRLFPRQENAYENLKEYSLSCACPTVVDLINGIEGEIKFSYEGDANRWESISIEHKIRERMIGILQNGMFSFNNSILIIFNMLLFIRKEPVITEEIISNFKDEKYLLLLIDSWSEIDLNNEDSCTEINELFIDIVLNYKKVKSFGDYLKDISFLAEDDEIGRNHITWNDFKMVFTQYEKLIENCMVSKIFANCISDDINELIKSFQVVITEYVMVKYSAYLKWLIDDKKGINYNDIQNYIVVYSRIIGHNADGIIEFWKDNFDEAVWEFGYMFLLIN